MHRSNQNFKHPPPGITQAFDCASCPGGGGQFERCLGRVGIFDPRRGNLNKPIFKSANTWGVAWGGGDVEASFRPVH